MGHYEHASIYIRLLMEIGEGKSLTFQPNSKFKQDYGRLYRKGLLAANTFLLLCELAGKNGQIKINEAELAELMAVRFEDPEEYAL